MAWIEIRPQRWRFNVDSHRVLEGRIVSISEYTGRFGVCKRYIIRAKEGLWSITPGVGFDRKFALSGLKEGDPIRIEYEGQQLLPDGKSVNVYRIFRWIEG